MPRYISPVPGDNPAFADFLEIYARDQQNRQNQELRRQDQRSRMFEQIGRGIGGGVEAGVGTYLGMQREERIIKAQKERDERLAALELDQHFKREFGVGYQEIAAAAQAGGQTIPKYIEQLRNELKGNVWGLPPYEQDQADKLDAMIATAERWEPGTSPFPNAMDALPLVGQLKRRRAAFKERWYKPQPAPPTLQQEIEMGNVVPDKKLGMVFMRDAKTGGWDTRDIPQDKNAEAERKAQLEEKKAQKKLELDAQNEQQKIAAEQRKEKLKEAAEQRKQQLEEQKDRAKFRNDLIKQKLEIAQSNAPIIKDKDGQTRQDFSKINMATIVAEADAETGQVYPTAAKPYEAGFPTPGASGIVPSEAGGAQAGAVPPPAGPPAPTTIETGDPVRFAAAKQIVDQHFATLSKRGGAANTPEVREAAQVVAAEMLKAKSFAASTPEERAYIAKVMAIAGHRR